MDDIPTTGVFDGLCVDGVGNVWVARWKDRRVIGYSPKGEILAMIRTPKAKSPTIPCFGGESFRSCQMICRIDGEPISPVRDCRLSTPSSCVYERERGLPARVAGSQLTQTAGKNLDTMYIITAHSSLAGDGDIQDQYPHSGDLFKVDFGPGSEMRKVLGDGWKGMDRHRFGL